MKDEIINSIMIGLGVTLVSLTGLGAGLQIYSTIKAARSYRDTPVYRDVNGDGIDDKIIKNVVEKPGVLWSKYNSLEEDTLFGVEVNGKKLYLPKDQFKEYQE